MSIQVYDNLIDQEKLDALANYAKKAKYSFGWKSNSNKKYDQGHFNHIIISTKKSEVEEDIDLSLSDTFKENQIIYDVWKNISIRTGKRQLVRAYFNLYTLGTEGYIHIDDPRANELIKLKDKMQETSLLYLTPDWHPDWAGETVIFDKKMDVLYATLPKYGRLLQFNGKLKHVGRGISRICREPRVVLALKTYRDTPQAEKAISFFQELTINVKHSKDTFFNHCFNIYKMLKEQSLEENICLAGLFHSIYGTQSFRSPINIERETVKSYIGDYAEKLVYEFCHMNPRFHSIMSNDKNFDFIEHYHLACIELANLAEQAPRIQIKEGRIESLKELVASFRAI